MGQGGDWRDRQQENWYPQGGQRQGGDLPVPPGWDERRSAPRQGAPRQGPQAAPRPQPYPQQGQGPPQDYGQPWQPQGYRAPVRPEPAPQAPPQGYRGPEAAYHPQPQFTPQPQYAPPPPPAQHQAPKPAAAKGAGKPSVLGCGCLAALAAAIGLGAWFLVSGGSGSSSPDAPASQAATVPASCASQLSAWAGTGEGSRLTAFSTDIDSFDSAIAALAAGEQDGDATTGEMSAVQGAAGTMQEDAQALKASPGPSCVPGLADNLYAAALDISTAATGSASSVGELSAGNEGTATSEMNAAAAAMDKGDTKITAADKALESYEASTGA